MNNKIKNERKCSKRKSLSLKCNFYKDITKIDGCRPECIDCTKQYHCKNREKRNLRERKRLAIDGNYRLFRNTRRRTQCVLNGKPKPSSTRDILGIDINLSKNWIEWQMTLEMNWTNIEIDHVKPFCMFDVSRDEDEAFSWNNVQPLLIEVHSQKGVKFNFLDYQFQII